MKFMMLMIPAAYRDNKKLDHFRPDPKQLKEMGRFNDKMRIELKVESVNGLLPLSKGARVTFSKGKNTVTDGPSIEAKEVLGGYWIVEAASKEELIEWARRCPAEEGDTLEIRQIASDEDLAPEK